MLSVDTKYLISVEPVCSLGTTADVRLQILIMHSFYDLCAKKEYTKSLRHYYSDMKLYLFLKVDSFIATLVCRLWSYSEHKKMEKGDNSLRYIVFRNLEKIQCKQNTVFGLLKWCFANLVLV